MTTKRKSMNTTAIAVIGCLIVIVIMIVGTMRTGESARKDTAEAVHSVSYLYLDELAGAENRSWRII